MSKILKYTVLFALSLLAFSCSLKEDYLESRGEGRVDLAFSYDEGFSPESKADASGFIFKVTVKDAERDVVVKTIEDHTSLEGSPITLREGKYVIIASNGEDVVAAFDSPYYMGSDTVDVVVGETAKATVHCTLANVKVTVSVADEMKEFFTEYSVRVNNGIPNGELYFIDDDFSREGFFRCTGSLFYTIHLVNTDGKSFEISNEIPDVRPRQYYNINIDMDGGGTTEQGASSIRVTVDGSMTEREEVIDISLNKKPKPVITESTGGSLTEIIRAPQGAGVVGLFKMIAQAGVKRVVVSHSSQELSDMGVPFSFNPLDLDLLQRTAINSKGLFWTDYEEGTNAIDFDFRKMFSEVLPLGEYSFTINVLDNEAQYLSASFTVKVIPNVEVSTISVDAWALFANVYAQWNTESEPSGIGFQYRKSGESSWSDFIGTVNKGSANTFYAKITGLSAETAYEFRAVTANEQVNDNIISATTEAMVQLPNFNFDSWFKNGKHWYPDADLDANFFWDSGNEGANTLSELNPTSPEESIVISGKAVKMESKTVLGVMAGGNIYSGDFLERQGTNAIISFGRPYNCRPTTLKGYYRYAPVAIDKTKDPYNDLKGTMDVGHIYVLLADWSRPYEVNSGEKNFLDPNTNPGVIAFGELIDDQGGTNGEYKEFTIDINYKEGTSGRKPTYVVVVATASKYADYFTGGIGSIMYIDEFQFGFE